MPWLALSTSELSANNWKGGEYRPASDDIAWQPPLPEHLESFCEIIRQAREEGHGPEIEQLIYSELEHV
jgi:hypothetical protein